MAKKEANFDLYIHDLLVEAGIQADTQGSNIVPINEALKTASKHQTGKAGFPEYTAVVGDFVLVMEDKADRANLCLKEADGTISMTVQATTDYAVNGALHYAQHILQKTTYKKVFAFGNAGDSKHHTLQPLFVDKNVIIDLSRVASTETKSLIMGILIMRLSEYRMTADTGMNAKLRHVTVLEEAHNILRRTSTEQSEEGSNLAGKSVEMIANAIAEMRTYGEGFIIADQSPSAVDISAIRNTNTKIIMRLPDEQDRELAGKAAALKDEQLDEIARFPKGVAVVYQNDWMEPVLCKVSKFDTEEQPDVLKKKSTIVSRKNEEQLLLRNLLKKEEGEALELNLQQLKERVLRLTLPTKTKIAALKALQKNGRCAPKDIQGVVYDLICTPMVEKDLDDAESLEEWRDEIIYSENAELSELSEEVQDKVCELILRERIKRFNQPEEYLTQWEEFCKRRVLE